MSTGHVLYDELLHWETSQPDAPFIIEAETGKTLSYGESIAALQALRRALGDEPSCILLALPGGMATSLIWLSALMGGHTLVPAAPDAPAYELERLTKSFSPDVVIIERPEEQVRFAFLDARFLTQADCEALIYHAVPDGASHLHPVDGWVCLMTSGSTGEPKKVILNAQQVAWTADQIRRSHQLSPADRGLAVLPFFHINAPVVSLCASLLAGSSVIIAPRFSRSRFWEWIDTYQITWASIVPTILALLLQTEKPDFLPGALRFVRTASAPLPAIQLVQFEQRFGIPVIETYGLTEAASQVCANPVPPGRHIPGSVGKPVGVSLRICQPHTSEGTQALRDVALGEVGEVCIAGPGVISAYLGDAGATAFQDGWFRTGDLGYQDAEGYVYLTGRQRDVIIRGGENIAPREIEEALLAHAAVWEVAVAGSPDPLYGEQVVAYVVTHESWTSLLEESLRLHCAQYLSPHKVPSVFIPVDALPRTYTGKLDRQALRQKQLDHVTEKVGIHAA
ncbi:MAG TPA: AMP-binding protein [Ktedonobacterales bacterium]|nr:AMP-binding protein [Ktedonobacterales bacterium]